MLQRLIPVVVKKKLPLNKTKIRTTRRLESEKQKTRSSLLLKPSSFRNALIISCTKVTQWRTLNDPPLAEHGSKYWFYFQKESHTKTFKKKSTTKTRMLTGKLFIICFMSLLLLVATMMLVLSLTNDISVQSRNVMANRLLLVEEQ